MARPRGSTGTKQLSIEEQQHIRTLYYDAGMKLNAITRVTGYSRSQIKEQFKLMMQLLDKDLDDQEFSLLNKRRNLFDLYVLQEKIEE
jgi:hypothetical protein